MSDINEDKDKNEDIESNNGSESEQEQDPDQEQEQDPDQDQDPVDYENIDDGEVSDSNDEDDINDEEEIDPNINSITNKLDINREQLFNNDLENNDSMEFLQKFGLEQKQDYIISNHQECLSKNFEEIKKLCKVIRNKDNIIIDELHKTIPILTKYEKAKILGIRIKQLNNGNKPYVSISENILDNNIVANLELESKKLPFIITRPIPNNTFEYWKLNDLELN